MFIASGLGFLKMLILAIVLQPQDYGLYVSTFGLAILAGAIGSFGLIEQTSKLYPRLWSDGKQVFILQDARGIAILLLSRFGFLTLVAILISLFLNFTFGWKEIICISLLASISALLALMSSLYRAVTSKKELENFSIVRGLSILVLGFVGGYFFGWRGAIFGDIIGSFLTCLFGIYVIKRLFGKEANRIHKKKLAKKVQKEDLDGHGKVYFSNLLTGSTSMADRALVSSSQGALAAGSYGFIMLVPQIFQMLINIASQIIGPQIIKTVYLNKIDISFNKELIVQGVIFCFLIAIFIFCVIASRQIPFFLGILMKYKISNLAIILSGLLSLSQIYPLIEFHLIALNAERFILIASLCSNIAFYLMFTLAIYLSLSVEFYIGFAIIARYLQVCILSYSLYKVKRKFYTFNNLESQ